LNLTGEPVGSHVAALGSRARAEGPLSTKLRFITYLAPSLPEPLFERVVRLVGERLGVATELGADHRTSGPMPGGDDPFSNGKADVGFLCAPPFLWLRERGTVELVGAGWVFDDPRAVGMPVYFSDVIVSAASPARSFADLRDGVWAYNDVCSLSGFHCLLRRLDPFGGGRRFFSAMVASGAHHTSMDWVARGVAHAAAIDSNGLRIALAHDPSLRERIRVLETWGPHPIQPIVARADLPADLRRAIAGALLDIGPLPEWGVRGFVPVDESLYAAERAALLAAPPADVALETFA
jgi:phosphonate ABC transporter substrate-binding protein